MEAPWIQHIRNVLKKEALDFTDGVISEDHHIVFKKRDSSEVDAGPVKVKPPGTIAYFGSSISVNEPDVHATKDGATWHPSASEGRFQAGANTLSDSACWTGDRFMVPYYGSDPHDGVGRLLQSKDGGTWSFHPERRFESNSIFGMDATGTGLVIAVGHFVDDDDVQSSYAVSRDFGETWEFVPDDPGRFPPYDHPTLDSVCVKNDLEWIVSKGSSIITIPVNPFHSIYMLDAAASCVVGQIQLNGLNVGARCSQIGINGPFFGGSDHVTTFGTLASGVFIGEIAHDGGAPVPGDVLVAVLDCYKIAGQVISSPGWEEITTIESDEVMMVILSKIATLSDINNPLTFYPSIPTVVGVHVSAFDHTQIDMSNPILSFNGTSSGSSHLSVINGPEMEENGSYFEWIGFKGANVSFINSSDSGHIILFLNRFNDGFGAAGSPPYNFGMLGARLYPATIITELHSETWYTRDGGANWNEVFFPPEFTIGESYGSGIRWFNGHWWFYGQGSGNGEWDTPLIKSEDLVNWIPIVTPWSGTYSPVTTYLEENAADYISVTLLAQATFNTGTSSWVTPSYTPAPNALLLAFIETAGYNTDPPNSITANGLTWHLIDGVGYNATVTILWVYRAMGPAPVAGSMTVVPGGIGQYGQIHVVQATGVNTSGVDGSGAIGNYDDERADESSFFPAGPSLTITIAGSSDKKVIVAGIVNTLNPGVAITPGSGSSGLGSTIQNLSLHRTMRTEWKKTTGLTIAASVPGSVTQWMGIAIELIPESLSHDGSGGEIFNMKYDDNTNTVIANGDNPFTDSKIMMSDDGGSHWFEVGYISDDHLRDGYGWDGIYKWPDDRVFNPGGGIAFGFGWWFAVGIDTIPTSTDNALIRISPSGEITEPVLLAQQINSPATIIIAGGDVT